VKNLRAGPEQDVLAGRARLARQRDRDDRHRHPELEAPRQKPSRPAGPRAGRGCERAASSALAPTSAVPHPGTALNAPARAMVSRM
jgi:hypothetical protein